MIKNVLSEIGSIGVFGVISVCLFFVVFTGALVRAILLNKTHAEFMSALPLDEDRNLSHEKGNDSHE